MKKVPQGNLYDDMANHMADIPDQDRTTSNVLATLKRDGSTWKIVR